MNILVPSLVIEWTISAAFFFFYCCVIKIGILIPRITFFFKFFYTIDVLRKLLWLLIIFLGTRCRDVLYSVISDYDSLRLRFHDSLNEINVRKF